MDDQKDNLGIDSNEDLKKIAEGATAELGKIFPLWMCCIPPIILSCIICFFIVERIFTNPGPLINVTCDSIIIIGLGTTIGYKVTKDVRKALLDKVYEKAMVDGAQFIQQEMQSRLGSTQNTNQLLKLKSL